MKDIIKRKNWYFIISLIIILPGIVSLFLYGLNLSIDYTGGSRFTLDFPKQVDRKTVQDVEFVLEQQNVKVVSVQSSGSKMTFRTSLITEKQNTTVLDAVEKKVGPFKEEDFETIGPAIGQETTVNAFKAIVLAAVLIVLYIAWSFRRVPKPTSSWRFGITAIATLIHDVLLLLGVFSILGHFFHVEVDSLFLTALLTVMGFSVHDTIVVFDRIRENLLRVSNVPFDKIVNDSILQTLVRSLNTSLTAILVLLGLLLFGGESTRWFIVALLIGIISGTYSSIFNAAPLLVLWNEISNKRKKRST